MATFKELVQVAYAWVQSGLTTRERGATAVEYAIMVAAIAAVIVAVVVAVGSASDTAFEDVNTGMAGLPS